MNRKTIKTLLTINTYVQDVVSKANEQDLFNSKVWVTVYDLVFSNEVSVRAQSLMTELGLRFDYCDPDLDYKDDVLAFAQALDDVCQPLILLHPTEKNEIQG